MKKLLLISIAVLFYTQLFSYTYYAKAGTFNWNDPLAWNSFDNPPAGSFPTFGDLVNIDQASHLTVTADVNIVSLSIQTSAAAASLTINSGINFASSSGTFLVFKDFTLNNNGTFSFPSFTFLALEGTQTGTINNTGTFTILTSTNLINSGGNIELNNTGTFNLQDVSFNAGGTLMSINLDAGDFNCNNITAYPAIPSNLTIDLSASNANFNIKGNVTGSDFTLNGGSSGSTVNFNGTAAQTFPYSATMQYHNLKCSNTAGLSPASDIPLGGITNLLENTATGIINQATFTINAEGVNNLGTFNADASLVVGNLGFTNSGSYISSGSNINIEGDWINTGTYTFQTGDVVMFDGTTTSATITGNTNFDELNINKSGQSVTASSGNIEITSILDIDAGSFIANGGSNVTLLSNASGTAQLDEIEAGGSYTGDLEVQRYLAMSNDGWRELTSPIISTNLSNWQDDGIVLTGFPGADYDSNNWFGWVNTWTYTEANAAGTRVNGWVAATSNTDATTFTKGHRIYIGTGSNTLSVKGTPVTGSQSVNISNGGSGSDENGWNLIGNPYPCTIDWNTLSTTNTDAAIWIWNATAGNYGIYQTNDATGTNGVDNEIAHSQAFWVHATGAGTVNFTESNKVRTDKAFVKSQNSIDFVKIKLSSTVNTFYDEAILTFNTEANELYNNGIDQNKLYTELADLAPSLAIVTSDNADLSIAGVNDLKSRSIPLKAFAGTTAYGSYTIDFDLPLNVLLNSCISLEDIETGVVTDLKTTNSYTFTITANSPQNRFVLHIVNPFDAVTINPTCANLTDGIILLEGGNINGNTFTIANGNGTINTITATSNQISFDNLEGGKYTITSSQNSSCGYNSIEVTIDTPTEVISAFSLIDDVITLENSTITLQNNSNGDSYTWNFGDGNTSFDENPTHTYTSPGIYTITLTVEANGCETSTTETIEVRMSATSVNEVANLTYSIITTDENLIIDIEDDVLEGLMTLTSTNGKVVYKNSLNAKHIVLDTKEFAIGMYLVTITNKEKQTTQKVVLK